MKFKEFLKENKEKKKKSEDEQDVETDSQDQQTDKPDENIPGENPEETEGTIWDKMGIESLKVFSLMFKKLPKAEKIFKQIAKEQDVPGFSKIYWDDVDDKHFKDLENLFIDNKRILT